MMKKILILAMTVILSSGAFAQREVTKFLGIPVDGTKQSMIQKLKAKGFTYDQQTDCLYGEFNGEEVSISVQTNGNKVWRIAITDEIDRSENQIRIRFNNLVNQFENNNKYMPYKKDSQTLSDNEDISYEISANDKQYAAIFYQYSKDAPEFSDILTLQKEYGEKYAKELKEYLSQFTEEQLENPTEEMVENSKKILNQSVQSVMKMNDLISKKVVWFTIGGKYGKYYISMFYENGYNEADGSDL
ncbi:MAG: hypothetical protein MSS57_05860 [Bacteroidales bacterium]|nr:hypothetical protein [Bacteroidales bacterium]